MPLSVHEKAALRLQFAELIEADEPEVVLGMMRRIAERMALRVTRGTVTLNEARRWQNLAEALGSVERQLRRRLT